MLRNKSEIRADFFALSGSHEYGLAASAVDRFLGECHVEGFRERLCETIAEYHEDEEDPTMWLLNMFRLRADGSPDLALKCLQLYIRLRPDIFENDERIWTFINLIMTDPCERRLDSEEFDKGQFEDPERSAAYITTVLRGLKDCALLDLRLSNGTDNVKKIGEQRAYDIVKTLVVTLRNQATLSVHKAPNSLPQVLYIVHWVFSVLPKDDNARVRLYDLGDTIIDLRHEIVAYDRSPEAFLRYFREPLLETLNGDTADKIVGRMCELLRRRSGAQIVSAIEAIPTAIDVIMFGAVVLQNEDACNVLSRLTWDAPETSNVFDIHISPALYRLVDRANANINTSEPGDSIEAFQILCVGLSRVVYNLRIFWFHDWYRRHRKATLVSAVILGRPKVYMVNSMLDRRDALRRDAPRRDAPRRDASGYPRNGVPAKAYKFCQILHHQVHFICSRINGEHDVMYIEILIAWLSLMAAIARNIHIDFLRHHSANMLEFEDSLAGCQRTLGSLGLAISFSAPNILGEGVAENVDVPISTEAISQLWFSAHFPGISQPVVRRAAERFNRYLEIRVVPTPVQEAQAWRVANEMSAFMHSACRPHYKNAIVDYRIDFLCAVLASYNHLFEQRGLGMLTEDHLILKLLEFCGFEVENVLRSIRIVVTRRHRYLA